jgi:hypothetical protein
LYFLNHAGCVITTSGAFSFLFCISETGQCINHLSCPDAAEVVSYGEGGRHKEAELGNAVLLYLCRHECRRTLLSRPFSQHTNEKQQMSNGFNAWVSFSIKQHHSPPEPPQSINQSNNSINQSSKQATQSINQ